MSRHRSIALAGGVAFLLVVALQPTTVASAAFRTTTTKPRTTTTKPRTTTTIASTTFTTSTTSTLPTTVATTTTSVAPVTAVVRDVSISQTVTGIAALGQPLRLETVVSNVGNVALPSFPVRQYASVPDTTRQMKPAGHFTVVGSTTGLDCVVSVNASTVEAVGCTTSVPLNPGAKLTLVTEYVPLVAGRLTLQSYVPANVLRETNTNFANNFATYVLPTSIPDVGPTDIAVAVNGSVDSIFTDQANFDYTITNNGAWGLSGVTVEVTSSAGFYFLPSGCSYNTTNTALVCRTQPIAAGASISNVFTVKRFWSPDGIASVTIVVTPPVADTVPANNTGRFAV